MILHGTGLTFWLVSPPGMVSSYGQACCAAYEQMTSALCRMVFPSHALSVCVALCHTPSVVSLAACAPAVVVASVQAQLQAVTNNKLVSQLHFNSDSSVDATRVVGVEWVPHTNGDLFVAAHSSGSVYTYSKVTSWNHLCMRTSNASV